MPKMRVLSGKEIVDILKVFDFSIVSQKGSHIKLRRELDGTRQTLIIPNHKELDRGTIKAIYNQALRFISEKALRKNFFVE